MYADALLAAEQRHLLVVGIWGVASCVAGIILLLLIRLRRHTSPLLLHFALQMTLWGMAIAASAAIRWTGVSMRDVSGAARLDRMLWFSSGVEIGIAATGFAIAATAWMVARRLAGVGAGLAIAAQGLALMVLDLQFITQITQ
jgi:hypothetical protein